MRNIKYLIWIMFLYSSSFAQDQYDTHSTVDIEWNTGSITGEVSIKGGKLERLTIIDGNGKIAGGIFKLKDKKSIRIRLMFSDVQLKNGPEASIVSVKTNAGSFSFFLRDVHSETPVYISWYQAIVTTENDKRSFDEIRKFILSRGVKNKATKIELEDETSFEGIKEGVRDMNAPIWLGMSRDMRMFEITEDLDDLNVQGKIIQPKFSSSFINIPELPKEDLSYLYMLGRGIGPLKNITRWLEDGTLPIYHSKLVDEDITYQTTSFVSLENSPLTAETNKGTNYMISDHYSSGRVFTPQFKLALDKKLSERQTPVEEAVLFSQTVISNNGFVPRYAWIKTPRPGKRWHEKFAYDYDPYVGFSLFSADRIFCISQLDSFPLPNEELAVLIQPGEKLVYTFFLPHEPISKERAIILAKSNFTERFNTTKSYWKEKLSTASKISVPERRVQEMINAGLLHLDLITFGEEPRGTLAANVGVYSPIGTETAPIIQFYLSMGWFENAKRCLQYFWDTQQDNGAILNYNGYMVETGAVLWSMGEYYRYTKDKNWLREMKPKILKACDYLIDWRNRNKREEIRGKGYGMIEGKVADPEEHFRQFMLNGYSYLGLSRVAEIMYDIDKVKSEELELEARSWKADILETAKNLLALSPVVPLGDGSWVPTLPPWAEAEAPQALFYKKEKCWTHGTFMAQDALLGPLYLVFCEVIDPTSDMGRMILDYNRELFLQGNSAFSQPYYSRHNWIQAKLGMVKQFLNTYYTTLAAQADRETYTFWEHMFRVSPHKTHEEAWFLMETRWMLYMEDDKTLSLLKTIPRKWMEQGKQIKIENAQSYFGALNIEVNAMPDSGFIEAKIICNGERKPGCVTIRLPHPGGKKPVNIEGGTFDANTETVTINSFSGSAIVRLGY